MTNVLVVAFAFGANRDILPNMRIMARAHALCAHAGDGARIFTQPELMAPEEGISYVSEGDTFAPASTLCIVREAIKYALEKDFDTIQVAAAPPHVRRCLRDFRFVLDELHVSINVVHEPAFAGFRMGDWFQVDAGHLHTSFRPIWQIREFIFTRLHQWCPESYALFVG